MKKILMVLILMGMNGGVYASDFSDLGVTAAELKASSSMNNAASLSDSKIVAVPVNSEEFDRTTAKAARILARPSACTTDELLEAQIDLVDLGMHGALSAGQKSQVSEYAGKLNQIIAKRMPAAPQPAGYDEVISKTARILARPSAYTTDELLEAQIDLIDLGRNGALSAGQKSQVSEYEVKLNQIVARRMPAAPRQLTYSEVIARAESILSNPSAYKLDDMYAVQLELIGQSIKGGLSAGQKSEISEHLTKLSQVIRR